MIQHYLAIASYNIRSNTLPILCSVTLETGIDDTPVDMLIKANKSRVISIVSLVSNTLPVVIVNKYIDWKGTCCITNGGIVPLIRKSPSTLDSPTISSIIMISNLKYSTVHATVTFGSMINNASNTTVPMGE